MSPWVDKKTIREGVQRDVKALTDFESALAQARKERIPVMALRHDSQGLDDVVVETPKMFRAEMMSDRNLWMCCYFDNDERVTFSVYVRKGRLEFSVTEKPAEWSDWDAMRKAAL